VVTLGGFITSRLGHIPQPGESFRYETYEIKVLEADERRVLKAELHRVAANGVKEQ
jgi:CBS domain containing-hemolysin-like protein